jgi:hypothetical protein
MERVDHPYATALHEHVTLGPSCATSI